MVLWRGYNPAARDFPSGGRGTGLSIRADGDRAGRVHGPRAKADTGWMAYFAELTYDVGAATPLKLTTDVRVTPDVLPFAAPNPPRPKGFLSPLSFPRLPHPIHSPMAQPASASLAAPDSTRSQDSPGSAGGR